MDSFSFMVDVVLRSLEKTVITGQLSPPAPLIAHFIVIHRVYYGFPGARLLQPSSSAHLPRHPRACAHRAFGLPLSTGKNGGFGI